MGSMVFAILHVYEAFKRQPHKMVKHTQIIRCQQPTIFLGVFDHFAGLALKVLSRLWISVQDW